MGYKLKTMQVDKGMFLSEKACANFCCSSCGQKMTSVNYVNGVCIQVFVTHRPDCGLFTGNGFERTVEASCESCRYYDGQLGCNYEGEEPQI